MTAPEIRRYVDAWNERFTSPRGRYTVTALDQHDHVVWTADHHDRVWALDLFRAQLTDPTDPVRRVVLCRDDEVIEQGTVDG